MERVVLGSLLHINNHYSHSVITSDDTHLEVGHPAALLSFNVYGVMMFESVFDT